MWENDVVVVVVYMWENDVDVVVVSDRFPDGKKGGNWALELLFLMTTGRKVVGNANGERWRSVPWFHSRPGRKSDKVLKCCRTTYRRRANSVERGQNPHNSSLPFISHHGDWGTRIGLRAWLYRGI